MKILWESWNGSGLAIAAGDEGDSAPKRSVSLFTPQVRPAAPRRGLSHCSHRNSSPKRSSPKRPVSLYTSPHTSSPAHLRVMSPSLPASPLRTNPRNTSHFSPHAAPPIGTELRPKPRGSEAPYALAASRPWPSHPIQPNSARSVLSHPSPPSPSSPPGPSRPKPGSRSAPPWRSPHPAGMTARSRWLSSARTTPPETTPHKLAPRQGCRLVTGG